MSASASHGGGRRRSPASTRAPSRKTPASSVSRRSRARHVRADFPFKVSALGEGSALGYTGAAAPARSHSERGAVRRRSRAGRSRSSNIPRRRLTDARCADVDRSAWRRAAGVSAAADARCTAIQSAGAGGLRSAATGSASDNQGYNPPLRRSTAPPIEKDDVVRIAALRAAGRDAASRTQPQSARAFAAAWAAAPATCRRDADRDQAHRDVGLPDRVGARSAGSPTRCSRRRCKWFGQPVVEIKQISAYSCRGMNGQVGAQISEHAFGNALDIAAFVLADGHRITVKGGWQGSPEEQGFLRDVQASACDQFTTVLAPGSNQFHYDHIHVDLMRRRAARRICNPGAVDGGVGRRRLLGRIRATPRRGRSSRRRPDATIRRSSRTAIRSPGAATPATTRPPPARSPRGGPESRTPQPKTSTGSRSPARGRPSTGARTSTRSIEGLFGAV